MHNEIYEYITQGHKSHKWQRWNQAAPCPRYSPSSSPYLCSVLTFNMSVRQRRRGESWVWQSKHRRVYLLLPSGWELIAKAGHWGRRKWKQGKKRTLQGNNLDTRSTSQAEHDSASSPVSQNLGWSCSAFKQVTFYSFPHQIEMNAKYAWLSDWGIQENLFDSGLESFSGIHSKLQSGHKSPQVSQMRSRKNNSLQAPR